MNWNRREEAALTGCVKYVYWCSDISAVLANRHWHVSELRAEGREAKEKGGRGWATEGKKHS